MFYLKFMNATMELKNKYIKTFQTVVIIILLSNKLFSMDKSWEEYDVIGSIKAELPNIGNNVSIDTVFTHTDYNFGDMDSAAYQQFLSNYYEKKKLYKLFHATQQQLENNNKDTLDEYIIAYKDSNNVLLMPFNDLPALYYTIYKANCTTHEIWDYNYEFRDFFIKKNNVTINTADSTLYTFAQNENSETLHNIDFIYDLKNGKIEEPMTSNVSIPQKAIYDYICSMAIVENYQCPESIKVTPIFNIEKTSPNNICIKAFKIIPDIDRNGERQMRNNFYILFQINGKYILCPNWQIWSWGTVLINLIPAEYQQHLGNIIITDSEILWHKIDGTWISPKLYEKLRNCK